MAVLFAGRSLDFYYFVAIVGLVNSYGALFSTKAIKINLAQSMIFLPLTGFVGVLLAALFLGESSLLNPFKLNGFLSLLGVAGSFLAMSFFVNGAGVARKMRGKWAFFIAGQTIVSGAAIFFIKYTAVQDIAVTSYLASWYSGTWLGSLIALTFGPKITMGVKRKDYLPYFFLSLCTWFSDTVFFGCVWRVGGWIICFSREEKFLSERLGGDGDRFGIGGVDYNRDESILVIFF